MATVTPNYSPMSLPAAGPRAGGGMGKGGGRPGGAPGMGGKGGGMRPPPPMGTRPDPFRGGPIGQTNPAGPPMVPQSPVATASFTPVEGNTLPDLFASTTGPAAFNLPSTPPMPQPQPNMDVLIRSLPGQSMMGGMQAQQPPMMPSMQRQSAPQRQPGLFNFMSRFGG